MKKALFVSLFVFVHLFFIFLHIHKSNTTMTQLYRKQKCEQTYKKLAKKKQKLTLQLHEIKNLFAIKKFAQKHLNMGTIKMSQIKKLPINE